MRVLSGTEVIQIVVEMPAHLSGKANNFTEPISFISSVVYLLSPARLLTGYYSAVKVFCNFFR